MTLTTETVLTLTPRAAAEVKDILTKPENAGKNFRVFDEQGDGDFMSEQAGVAVLVDAISAQYLRGTVVDFSDALTAGGFKITNPKAGHSCGCGKSFEPADKAGSGA